MQYLSTPCSSECKFSPAELMFNRKFKTKVPCFNKNNSENGVAMRNDLLKRQVDMKKNYDKTASNELSKFKTGDVVKYRNTMAERIWRTGQIYKQRQTSDRSYDILTKEGRIISRNRKMVRPDPTHPGGSMTIAHPLTSGHDKRANETSTKSKPMPVTVSNKQPESVVSTPLKPASLASAQINRACKSAHIDIQTSQPRRSGRTCKQTEFYGDPVTH